MASVGEGGGVVGVKVGLHAPNQSMEKKSTQVKILSDLGAMFSPYYSCFGLLKTNFGAMSIIMSLNSS
jgi:hypothetical protein